MISVKDQGAGIPEKHISRIFDPYFSTKENGSGLGLASCYSIIHQHGGYILVESEEGIGTAFHIYLPASEKELLKVKKIEKQKPYFGHGKILFMDDELDVINTALNLLSDLGYEVETARTGTEAITLYQKAKKRGEEKNYNVNLGRVVN